MICRRIAESGPRAQEQMTIYSYRRPDSMYVVTVLLPGGQVWNYSGRPEGNRWVLYLDSPRLDDTLWLRQVIIAGTDTLHFMEEVSANGGQWRLSDPSEDYRYVRAATPQR